MVKKLRQSTPEDGPGKIPKKVVKVQPQAAVQDPKAAARKRIADIRAALKNLNANPVFVGENYEVYELIDKVCPFIEQKQYLVKELYRSSGSSSDTYLHLLSNEPSYDLFQKFQEKEPTAADVQAIAMAFKDFVHQSDSQLIPWEYWETWITANLANLQNPTKAMVVDFFNRFHGKYKYEPERLKHVHRLLQHIKFLAMRDEKDSQRQKNFAFAIGGFLCNPAPSSMGLLGKVQKFNRAILDNITEIFTQDAAEVQQLSRLEDELDLKDKKKREEAEKREDDMIQAKAREGAQKYAKT